MGRQELGWLVASEFSEYAHPARSWSNGRLSDHADRILAQGTIVAEVKLRNGIVRPSRLVSYESTEGWFRRFILFLNPDGSVSVEHRQGGTRAYVRVSSIGIMARRIRITYSWSGPARNGLLTVEDVDNGTIRQALQNAPLPMQIRDARAIASGRASCRIDPAVLAVSVSDAIQRIGPGPAIAAGTKVKTATSFKPVERIRPGDLVATQSGALAPVRWIVSDPLPGVGFNAPIRLRAPYYGLQSSITVASTHMVQAAGTETEHLVGRNNALIEAGHLIGHPGAERDREGWVIPYFQLLLDRHACINLAGIWAESLFIGNLRRAEELVVSTHFAEFGAAELPFHRQPVCVPLADYEKLSVLDALTA